MPAPHLPHENFQRRVVWLFVSGNGNYSMTATTLQWRPFMPTMVVAMVMIKRNGVATIGGQTIKPYIVFVLSLI